MDRKHLIEELNTYKAYTEEEKAYQLRILNLLAQERDCFHRHLLQGHITGSAWIINPLGSQVLLLHHRKLDKWLQPGGHADGEENVLQVAEREAREETGLSSIRVLKNGFFDLDIHSIPARKDEPEHFHYDIRYLFTASPEEPLQQNRESKGLAWLPLSEVLERTGHNSSISRMVDKTRELLSGSFFPHNKNI